MPRLYTNRCRLKRLLITKHISHEEPDKIRGGAVHRVCHEWTDRRAFSALPKHRFKTPVGAVGGFRPLFLNLVTL